MEQCVGSSGSRLHGSKGCGTARNRHFPSYGGSVNVLRSKIGAKEHNEQRVGYLQATKPSVLLCCLILSLLPDCISEKCAPDSNSLTEGGGLSFHLVDARTGQDLLAQLPGKGPQYALDTVMVYNERGGEHQKVWGSRSQQPAGLTWEPIFVGERNAATPCAPFCRRR